MSGVPSLKLLRSVTLFVVGLIGVLYEIFVEHGEKPTLLLLLGAMMGLPKLLSIDEKRRSGNGPPKPDGGSP